ncbi:hypothetical protein CLAFUW4_12160 [Fulvia fulva]|uniref:Uncharacterized protein n=1 Tax=Passalora fulva TaxID=5499 RepID=A0A9Q8USH5_PASFU|nr:uncharacterized protein CLAFUR5_11197 [Fulvia fulva]KAK4618610.1 hypothetical protein CLAFUR0_12176 [Fulvia fulva]UJO20786.1 hypothetical protein CLAFUR5_11197 [Fulvia fulva]WPV18299.1 hypothetical protein CLAFUW4_12160 [Fulvia fulva]WPV33419.1 hypothetical protein CLAFUW7_12167 [Fulvia fulva]
MATPNTSTGKTIQTPATSDSLPTRVQALPQELFDIIYDYTFTASPTTLNVSDTTTSAQVFPRLLHVSRASRKQFAESLYTTRIIDFGTSRIYKPWYYIMDAPERVVSMAKLGTLRIGGERLK